MAWTVTHPKVHNAFSSLGQRHGDTYTVYEDCLTSLEEILNNLITEDCPYRTYRRSIGFGQNVQRDLIPILISVRNDGEPTNASKIIDTTIKILVNLTTPIEYLLSIDSISNTDVGRHTIFDLNQLLISTKEAFKDGRSVRAVINHIKFIVEKDQLLSVLDCDSVNNCLLLLRNVLYAPDPQTNSSPNNVQNQIIWNMFTQSVDKIIIQLLSCPQKFYWGVTTVQVIALMYKDQHVGTLQKLLNQWLEVSLSESSEDNESNTSPPDRDCNGSSPVISSDPTSDSSDTGLNNNINVINNLSKYTTIVRSNQKTGRTAELQRNKSTETETSTSSGISLTTDGSGSNCSKLSEDSLESVIKSAQTPPERELLGELSDCGYGTQVENQEFVSTSSNDDDQPQQKPLHQKPHVFQKSRHKGAKNKLSAIEKKELRRKKLLKHSKTNIINMKGLVHHVPTDEDITNVLKEFTVDFLLKGYAALVRNLHSQLTSTIHVDMDTSHFFWLMTYFLKFATELELNFEHIAPILSYDIISYLVFQGVVLCEDLEMGVGDLTPRLRRLHLVPQVVTAIREFLHAVQSYEKLSCMSEEDRSCVRKLQIQLGETEDLRKLFVMLLRYYRQNLQSKQYLQDLILTNHSYLLLLDQISDCKEDVSFNVHHLKQFATVDMMHQYGLLLENFSSNGEFVNNCIFTMMHHVAGDLESVHVLFQPHILKTFSNIWEIEYELCDDWTDLIEYVIHKFINTRCTYCPPVLPDEHANAEKIYNDHALENNKEQTMFKNFEDMHDAVAMISKKYHENGIANKTKHSIIKELLDQNIINENQYRTFMKVDFSENQKNNVDLQSELPLLENLANSSIDLLRDYIFRENKGKLVTWLQKNLIETCFVKLYLTNPELFEENVAIMQPTTYFHALLNLPIPVVSWTEEETNILEYRPFVLLLHKLGLHLPIDTGKVFIRIPNFWNAEYTFSIAQKLGTIDATKLKFDVNLLQDADATDARLELSDDSSLFGECMKFSMNDQKMPSIVRYTPLLNNPGWFQPSPANSSSSHSLSQNLSKPDDFSVENAKTADEVEYVSTCDTDSVASNLTRMYVSDEEDKMFVLNENK